MFTPHNFTLELVAMPFGNLQYRDRTTLILCRHKGEYLLATSPDFFPKRIVRMVGGGIDKDESALEGAVRELKEEMGITIEPEELIQLAEVKVVGTYQGKTYSTTIYLYLLDTKENKYQAGDDAVEIVSLSESEYRELIKRFLALQPGHLCTREGLPFSWGDYGQVYGYLHKLALDEVLSNKL